MSEQALDFVQFLMMDRPKMYKDHLETWNSGKYIKGAEMNAIVRKEVQRARVGNRANFFIRGARVAASKIEQYRNGSTLKLLRIPFCLKPAPQMAFYARLLLQFHQFPCRGPSKSRRMSLGLCACLLMVHSNREIGPQERTSIFQFD